jgi:hypothetical protein
VTRRGAFTACGVVFVASACTLVLEIAAGRLLAPYLGVSLWGANPVVLTDDYAPADNLMAPIFLERDL